MKLSCHQCGSQTFWVGYDKSSRVTAAACEECDAQLTHLNDGDRRSGQQVASSAAVDLPPMSAVESRVRDACISEGGAHALIESTIQADMVKLLMQYDVRIKKLEASK